MQIPRTFTKSPGHLRYITRTLILVNRHCFADSRTYKEGASEASSLLVLNYISIILTDQSKTAFTSLLQSTKRQLYRPPLLLYMCGLIGSPTGDNDHELCMIWYLFSRDTIHENCCEITTLSGAEPLLPLCQSVSLFI